MRAILHGVFLRGIPCSVCGMLAVGLLLTAADFPVRAYPAFAAVPLLCGCFFSGMDAGRRRRRRGLLCGALSALLLTGIWYAAAVILSGKAGAPAVLCPALPCGMTGGMLGTGRRAPKLRRRMHGAVSLRERLRLRLGMLHRPDKKSSPAQRTGDSV